MQCPKCEEEITYLDYSETYDGYNYGRATLSRRGNLDYDERSSDSSNREIVEYECPRCHNELFTDDEDAIEFLKQETEIKSTVLNLFLCTKHNIGFNEYCEQCRNEEK